MGINLLGKLKEVFSLNESRASEGILFFFFSTILLAYEPTGGTVNYYFFELPAFWVWAYMVLGLISLTISVIFILSVFIKWLGERIGNLLRGPLACLYWVVFWFAYIISFLTCIASVISFSAEAYIVLPVFYIGLIWFLIITVLMFRAIGRSARR